jgi:hypothetical protein
VENSKDTPKRRNDGEPKPGKPPGEFVNDELEAQTKRFLEDIKGLAKRRREALPEEQPGPPRRDEDQRSRRR